MKILVVFTGGTIGSSVQEGYISPDYDAKYKLIQMYQTETKDMQEFDVDMPYTVLSENLNGKYISKLVRCLSRHISTQKYNGIIITHGTDTLQYTAAALGILFRDIKIPIILVSSNYHLEDERANGLYNFMGAVEYIKNNKKQGVFVSYKNTKEDTKILDACSILRYDIYSDELRNLPKANEQTTFPDTNKQVNIFKANDQENADWIQNFELQEFSPVKYILPYPGMRFELPNESIRAVLFGSYHSGTISTDSRELRIFCEEMKQRKIPMYICGVPEGIGYESTKYYEELGIRVLPKGTDVYWYMKLWIETSY